MTDITLAHADDWVGIYKDGKLIYEDHDIEPERLLKLFGIETKSRWVDDEWICYDSGGHLPADIEDVKWEKEDEGSQPT